MMLIPATGSAAEGKSAVEYGKNGRKKAKKKAAKKKRKVIKKATRAIRNGLFSGTTARGANVVWTFCRNGKYEVGTINHGTEGVTRGRGWKVTRAKKTKRGFWAIVKFERNGFVAISKKRNRWKVGIERSGKPSRMGKAERINAKKTCKNL